MSESADIVLILMGEFVILLLVGIGATFFFQSRRGKRDRDAARKLVEQIKHQSETRRQHTGSFLEEKYHFEGAQLQTAVDAIDKSEKKFYQKVINLYLNRDAQSLESLDAAVAEMIDVYKSLSPAVRQSGSQGDTEEVANLRAENAQLAEELEITKNTMSSMIAEFGNMFAGGADNELSSTEVLDKVSTDSGEAAEDGTAGAEAGEAADGSNGIGNDSANTGGEQADEIDLTDISELADEIEAVPAQAPGTKS